MLGQQVTSQSGRLSVRETTLLTVRQAEVLELAACGLSSKQIASHLGISARTVEDHFATLRQRIGARNRSELIAHAVAAGLITMNISLRLGPGPGEEASCDARQQPGPGTAGCDETPQWSVVSSQCDMCGKPVTAASTGRPRLYCSRACQGRAYRARRRTAAISASLPVFPGGTAPST